MQNWLIDLKNQWDKTCLNILPWKALEFVTQMYE